MSGSTYSHIVIGAGALGSATAYWLSRASDAGSVAVCEQFEPGHPWGSSDDHSRIIRHAYHSSDYTALTPAMFEAWREVEAHAGTRLVVRTGGLDFAESASAGAGVLARYCQAMDARAIRYEWVDVADVRRRWPQWRIADDVLTVYQADAGLLDIRKATAAQLRLARQAGATVLAGCTVEEIRDLGDSCEVRTSAGTLSCATVSICAGSWAESLLTRLGSDLPLELTQEQVQYFAPSDLDSFAPERFPVWIWHGDQDFYGFPVYGEPGVKAARDMTGRFVTQQTRSFEPDEEETARIREFLADRLPTAVGPVVAAKTCVYDLPRDRELVFGTLPGSSNIHVAVGAGHAGKFASLIGKVLADLATSGGTDLPIEPFSPSRPSLRNSAPARYRLGTDVVASSAAQ